MLFSGKEWRTASGSALLTGNDNDSTRPILGPSQVKLPAQLHREDSDIAKAVHSHHQPCHGNQISMMLRQTACFSRVTVRKLVSFHPQKSAARIQTLNILPKKRDFQAVLLTGHFISRQPYYNYCRRQVTQFNRFSRNLRIFCDFVFSKGKTRNHHNCDALCYNYSC